MLGCNWSRDKYLIQLLHHISNDIKQENKALAQFVLIENRRAYFRPVYFWRLERHSELG